MAEVARPARVFQGLRVGRADHHKLKNAITSGRTAWRQLRLYSYFLRKLTFTGSGPHLNSNGIVRRLSLRRRLLVHSLRAFMVITIETANRGGRGGPCPVWQARHIQYRPRIVFHVHRLHGGVEEGWVGWMRGGVWRDDVLVERLWRSIN